MRLIIPSFSESIFTLTLFDDTKAISIPEKNAENSIEMSVIIASVVIAVSIYIIMSNYVIVM